MNWGLRDDAAQLSTRASSRDRTRTRVAAHQYARKGAEAPRDVLPIVSRLSAGLEILVAGARNHHYLQLWRPAA
jgi:hypothetical protein